jgi:protein-S-isoprenylcysteine O-methyltransferase Ste14
LIAILLLTWPRFAGHALCTRFLPWSVPLFWIGTAVLIVGLLFSVAARRHLGGNWSGTVTLKQDHTLTRSGPYRFVRHPIYTGLLLAIFGSGVIALGEWRGLVALALTTVAILRKIQIEERFMLEQFGVAYARYRQEVAALIPGILWQPLPLRGRDALPAGELRQSVFAASGNAQTNLSLRGALRRSNPPPDKRSSALQAGDCFGARRLAMTGSGRFHSR